MSEKISINVSGAPLVSGTVMFRGVDIAPTVSGIDVRIRVGELTQVTLYMSALDVQLDADDIDVDKVTIK